MARYRDRHTASGGNYDHADALLLAILRTDAHVHGLCRPDTLLARAVTVGCALDDTFVHPQRGIAINLRWVYVHMIEEYARHNGHADLLRERIDGVTGAQWGGG